MDIDDIVETFELLDTGEDRYRYLLDLGKELEGLPDEAKTEANRVHGCMSRVWMTADLRDGAMQLHADSDAFIVRGLIRILLALYSGHTPAEIASIDPGDTFARIGLDQHLSMGRRNGLYSMVQRIKALAASA